MNAAEPRLLRVEAVADLPVLWATFRRLDLPATLDRLFPAPPHWKGPLTPGEVLAVWLLFLISQGDHCLNHVQPWVAQHRGTLSALLGKPVLPTHAHDDRLAVPAIRSVQQSLGVGGRTYVGDCKMAALATRAFVAASGDFYLCPLSEAQVSRAQRRELLRPVWDGTQPLQQVRRPGPKGGPDELVAEGFAVDVGLAARVGEKEVVWTEGRWLVRSRADARSQEAGLEGRLGTATGAG